MPHRILRLPSILSAFSRLLVAAATSLVLASCDSDPSDPATPWLREFDSYWQNFESTYSYFSYKQINWDSLRTVYRPQAATVSSRDELIVVLRQMSAPLRDVHVWFQHTDGRTLRTYSPNAAINWQKSAWEAYVRRNGWQQVSTWGFAMMGDVGYIAIGSWNTQQVRTAAVDSVLEILRGARAMIVDVRMNGGGNDQIALEVAARFTDRTLPVEHFKYRNGPGHDNFTALTTRQLVPRGPWQFTKPVIVLSGRGVFSSNESFISAMRELPHVTIMGDTTGGSSGNPRSFELGGGWSYGVPRWVAYTADLRVIEWNGIPPDIAIPTGSLDFTITDPLIDAARTTLTSTGNQRKPTP
jgi:hypothetical protein